MAWFPAWACALSRRWLLNGYVAPVPDACRSLILVVSKCVACGAPGGVCALGLLVLLFFIFRLRSAPIPLCRWLHRSGVTQILFLFYWRCFQEAPERQRRPRIDMQGFRFLHYRLGISSVLAASATGAA